MTNPDDRIVVAHTQMVTVSTLRDRRDANVFELVAEQAAKRPGAIAIIGSDGTTTTYHAVVDRAVQISNDLVSRGLQPEQTVGVLMHRTADLLATLLGVLRAGGAYVPLDPTDPIERSRRMLAGAGCRIVIGHVGPLAALRETIANPISSESVGELGGNASEVPLEFLDVERLGRGPDLAMQPCAPGGNRLAYVLFTSGSTGAPKGVEIEHRNMTWLLSCAEEMFAFTPEDRYIATATVAFDISVAELYLPLVTGGSLLLRDRDLLLRPRELADEIKRHGVTVFQTGPSLWKVILNELPDFPHLRVAITTGEATPPELVSRLAPIADRFWNLYGPTETTVWTTGARLDLPPTGAHGRSSVATPIGWPMTDVEMIVVDCDNMEVPDGVQGELLLGGPAVGRGYFGNPELTAKRFITLANGRRYYRSGDLSERAPDGSFAFHGRNDDQIKVRGVRIEPMEVESTILADPFVARAAATWFPTTGGNRALVAAVVCKPEMTTTASDLRDRLAAVLPVQMVPSRYIFVDSLPLTPSGKVDRVAIRDRATVDEPATRDDLHDLELFSPTERTVAEIWSRTLGLQSVARDDQFFSIGGDSLAAVTMMLDIEDAFSAVLPVQLVFDSPMLSELAARIDASIAGEEDAIEVHTNANFVFPLVQRGSGRPVFFASVEVKIAQKGVWKLDCPLYAVSYAARGKGLLRAKTLQEFVGVHVRAIREIQPQGPYRIAGYSFGGLVAVEIARQLREAGQEIELLFLLDPTEPVRTTEAPKVQRASTLAPLQEPVETFGKRMMRHMQHATRNPDRAISYLKEKVPLMPRAVLNTTFWGPRFSHHVHHFHLKHPNAILQRLLPTSYWPAFWYGAERLANNYVLNTSEGNVLAVFLRNRDRGPAWRPYLGSTAEIRRVTTSHHGLFVEPAMSTWVGILEEQLSRTESSALLANHGA